ncbi:MAG: BamA/TamA family outer membrane protein, partial [Cyclobacteriaceae bacterium]
SGNLLYLLQKGLANDEGDEEFSIFGSRYSQFLRSSIDVRHYLRLNKNHRFASRLIFGVGSAYGNSDALPVSRQFAIGGSSSIRAFRARSLGPGRFSQADTSPGGLLIDQTADVKIEANLEYRHVLTGQFEGAVFIDAGNIWTLRTDPNRPGAEFRSDSFLSDMAIGTGYGLRFDANFFILRLDLAFPLRVPNVESKERWVVRDIAVSQREWRINNLVWNIALGYPF